MILKKLTASFGKLKNETLHLQEGLNVITLPNEAGKSTWSEFLLAMLYGVDTSQRQRIGGPIPVKERYKPWDGTAMQGSIELIHDGKDITIERTSSARAPMSQFSAYQTHSGLPVNGLDSSNCGTFLIGAERSVYERSGFLRQRSFGLSKDASLEQRLASLVSAADETYSYSEIEKSLTAVKNRCKHNKTGLLPETERELSAVTAQLAELEQLQQTLSDLQQREHSLKQQQSVLQQQLQAFESDRARQQQENIQLQQAHVAALGTQRAALEQSCSSLPPKTALRALSYRIAALQDQTQTAMTQAALSRSELPQAPNFPVFAGLSAEDATKKAAQDCQSVQTLLSPVQEKRRSPLPLFLAAAAAVLCTVLALVLPFWPLLFFAGLFAVCIPLLLLYNARKKKQTAALTAARSEKAAAILAPYHADSPQQLPHLAAQYAAQTADYQARLDQIRQQTQAQEAAFRTLSEEKARLLSELQAIFGACESLPAGNRLLQEAFSSYAALEEVSREERSAQNTLDLLCSLANKEPSAPSVAPFAVADFDSAQAAGQLEETNRSLEALRKELHRTQGMLDGMGDRVALQAKKEQLAARRQVLSQKNEALVLALETLAAANREVQDRFSPLLCDKASALFAKLTGGKYDKLLLNQELSALCREAESNMTHAANALSCGTVDQAYLAVRLAICELLLKDAPIVLDDALVAFDDTRCRLAMEVLREIANTRQVIVFTCQQREVAM